MANRPLGMFLRATVAAVFGALTMSAHGVAIDVEFDPSTITGHFTGNARINFICSDPTDSETCTIDLIAALITNSGDFGPGWFSNGQSNIATNILSDNGLIAFDSIPVQLLLPSDLLFAAPAADGLPCSPSLMFTSTFDLDFLQHNGFIANLGCVDGATATFTPIDNAVYVLTAVPEPGTLALILGGVGAGWLTRRRKVAT